MNNNQNRNSISFIDRLRNSVFIILTLISTNIIYSSAQDITLKMNNSNLVQVIDEIEAISEYKFIYSFLIKTPSARNVIQISGSVIVLISSNDFPASSA